MFLSPFKILLIILLVALLFGRGRISGLMGDVAKGIRSFRKEMKDDAPQAKITDESKNTKRE